MNRERISTKPRIISSFPDADLTQVPFCFLFFGLSSQPCVIFHVNHRKVLVFHMHTWSAASLSVNNKGTPEMIRLQLCTFWHSSENCSCAFRFAYDRRADCWPRQIPALSATPRRDACPVRESFTAFCQGGFIGSSGLQVNYHSKYRFLILNELFSSGI